MQKIEVYCVGELLVDIIPKREGKYYEGFELEIHLGGAPANVCIGISLLNHKSGVIASVGNDPFGDFLINFLKEKGVDTKYVVRKNMRTSLAFVLLKEKGERDFFFYAKPWTQTAFTELTDSDVSIDDILKTKVIYTSGLSTAFEPIYNVIKELFVKGYKKGIITIFDPNYRKDAWDSEQEALKVTEEYLQYTRVLSMSMDEVRDMFKVSDYKKLTRDLISSYESLNIVAIRMGEKGAYVYTKDGKEIESPAYKIEPIDTTGAGDVWTAAFIVYHILESKSLEDSVRYANAAGALKCLRRGGASFPGREELENFIKRYSTS